MTFTSTRYYLNPDGSLRTVIEAGRCAEYWRLRNIALSCEPESSGHKETMIRLRIHEEKCLVCGEWFAECERVSLLTSPEFQPA